MSSIPPCPKGGWIPELQAAKAESKKHPKSVQAKLRYAEAAAAVRQWKVCKVAAQVGLHLSKDDSENADSTLRLKELARRAERELSIKSLVEKDIFLQEIKPNILENGANIDNYNVFSGDPCFTNFNLLQHAANRGDMRLMEQAVAMGAALDHPVLPHDSGGADEKSPAPAGATALLMACSYVALQHCAVQDFGSSNHPRETKRQVKRIGDCAAQLVMLGADPTVQFDIQGDSGMDPVLLSAGFDGMSAEECARMSGHTGLIEALDRMADQEAALQLVHCRCGSRLPWKKCHAGAGKAESPIYTMEENKVCWRYSPLALCPCHNTKKLHYKCCWDSAFPSYKNDVTGKLTKLQSMLVTPEMKPFLNMMQKLILSHVPNDEVFPTRDTDGNGIDSQKARADFVRAKGLVWIHSMCLYENEKKSKVAEWDSDVYAGCIEHQDPGRFFLWHDVHWHMDKPELLLRVKEWNEALESYCDEKGLEGAERESVVERNKASPYAPCANPPCDVYEKSVKGFRCCSQCKKVAYCSKNCQRAHWREHKKGCMGP